MRLRYWLPPRCDVLQRQLDLVHFDTAVNMGVGRAVKLLQASLGCGVDGAFGPATRKAVESMLVAGREHVFESESKDRRRTDGRRHHERRPDVGA